MSCLIKKNKRDYYSRVSVRVGDRQSNKRKDVYIKLDTYKYSFAKKRNAIVTREENKIRLEIKKGYATKSDLLNINELVEWEWLKECGLTSMKIHTLKEYADKFIAYKTSKKMRESTIDSYRYSLNKFVDSIGSKVLVSDIRQDHIDDFVSYLENRQLSQASIDSNLKGVSVFLKWCEVRGYIEKCPIIEYIRPIIDDKWLTESEYNAILNFEYKPISNNYHSNLSLNYKRYAKVFKLYAETGMRLSEGFYGVLTEDENGIWLAIPNEHSKSKKGRTIELNEEQRDTILMMQRLWYENDCKKLHIKYYSRMFRKVCDKLNIPKNKSFHSLRHMFGKRMITITGNIYKVSGLMGHSSVKVTEDSYVKGFDRKSTLRDFPSLKPYLISDKNTQKQGGWGLNGGDKYIHSVNISSLNYE
jgi:integrase/recombinase XerD